MALHKRKSSILNSDRVAILPVLVDIPKKNNLLVFVHLHCDCFQSALGIDANTGY
jgi:hypothetical protein